jgi:predicted nuclease of predicted toxin-antitoxin system
MDLPQQNASRDGVLNEVSVAEQRVVVTKDTDFYFSHLLHGRPWKLVLVRTGNLGLQATKQMFQTHLTAIEAALQTCTLVELDQKSVTVVA